jgi:selenocysteine lyase/cysteine desulfurase
MKSEQVASERSSATDWRTEWFEFDDVAYLNAAGQAPMPRVSIRAAQTAIEWKKYPHKIPDDVEHGLVGRVRELLARMIGADTSEIAVTTGASSGLAVVAHGIEWRPDDEVLIARGEFPAHFATWLPMQDAGRLRVRVAAPRERFLATEDLISAITPRTRLISTSLVRFDNAARCDAAKLADAIHAVGGLLLLDVSQCVGAMPMTVAGLGADFLVAAGYKWLLSPYGTGFFWARKERIAQMRSGPANWKATESAEEFHKLSGEDIQLTKEARRWDAPETSSFFNLAPMQVSLEFLHRVGVHTVWVHNRALIGQIIERLPLDRCILASPADPDARGPYVCIAARKASRTPELYEKLRAAGVIVSLREGALRIAPHLYNTEMDVDRLIRVLTA